MLGEPVLTVLLLGVRWRSVLAKHWTEVTQINSSIVTISPVRVDVPSSSQRVGFGAQSPRMEADDKIELG